MIKDFQRAWGKRTFEEIKYSLAPDDGYTDAGNKKAIYLVNLESKVRGKGHAKKFLNELIDVADQTKTFLSLIPDADMQESDALTQKQLETLYLRFGFVPTKLRADGEVLEMLRNPKND